MEYQHYQATMNVIHTLDLLVAYNTMNYVQTLKEYEEQRENALDTLTIAQRVHERRKRSSQ